MNGLKRIFAVHFFLYLLSVLFGCEAVAQETLSTTRGTVIPRKIVSLAPSVTETLFALGLGDRLVGVTTFCNYPAEALRISKIGSYVKPSIEAILAKQPDLVIGISGITDQETIKQLERLGLKTLVIPLSSLRDIFGSIRLLAQVTGRPGRGAELLSQVERQLGRVQERVEKAKRRRVLMVVGLRPLVAVGPGSYIHELLTFAGGMNIVEGSTQPWVRLPLEYVIAKAPQVIIQGVMGSERDSPGQYWKDLSSIPAVQEGRLYSYASDKILRPGPRIGEALEEIARLIHPECFDRSYGRKDKEHRCGPS